MYYTLCLCFVLWDYDQKVFGNPSKSAWVFLLQVVWRRYLSAISCLAPRRPVLLLLSHSLWWIVLPPPPAICNEAERIELAPTFVPPLVSRNTPHLRPLCCTAAIPSISEDTVMQGCCAIVLSVCCMLVSHRALCPVSSPVIVPACNLGSMTVRTLGYLVDSVSRDLEQSIWCLPSQLHWIYTHSPSHTEAWSLSKSKQKLWYSIYTSSQ